MKGYPVSFPSSERAILRRDWKAFRGISPSAVGQDTQGLEERLKEDAKLSEKVNQLRRILSGSSRPDTCSRTGLTRSYEI